MMRRVASGRTLTVDGSLLGSADTLTFNGSHETNGHFSILGGAGNDLLTGGAQSDSFDLTHAGNDFAIGGGGDDSFVFGAELTTADHIDGGNGDDTVSLDGDYAIALSGSVLSNVEHIVLAAGHSYSFSFGDDLVVASGQSLAFDGSALGASNTLAVNAVNETDGAIVFKGGAGDDSIVIGSAAVLAASSIDGGADVTVFRDRVTLDGDFSAGVTLSAANLTNIETLKFVAGHDYTLTAADGLVPTGIQLDVRGDVGADVGLGFDVGLGVGDSLSFDGSAETHGSFYLHGGKGDDTLIGSSQNDAFEIGQGGSDIATGGNGNEVFYAGAAGWDATDQLNGGAGFDYIYSETSANVNITFGANSLLGIEEIQVSQHFNLGSFTFVMNDANVAAGQSMIIDGHILGDGTVGAPNPLSVNASAETDGHYTISGGRRQ